MILRIRQILLFHTICPTQGTPLVLGVCAQPRFEGKSHQMSVHRLLIRDEELPDTKGLAQGLTGNLWLHGMLNSDHQAHTQILLWASFPFLISHLLILSKATNRLEKTHM